MDQTEPDSTAQLDKGLSKSLSHRNRTYRRPISCEGQSTTDDAMPAPPVDLSANQDGRNSTDALGNKRKKKNRRAKRRRWKPYHKLSTEQQRDIDQRQAEKAERIRAERLANGQPMAPYNTTSFLVEDLEKRNEDALLLEAQQGHHHHRERTTSGSMSLLDSEGSMYSGTSSGGDNASVGDPDELEFEAEMENAEAERLEAIPKPELVRMFMRLTHQLDEERKAKGRLQKQLEEVKGQQKQGVFDEDFTPPIDSIDQPQSKEHTIT